MLELLASDAFGEGLDRTVLLFALVLARTVPIVELAPFLGGRATPRTVKTAVAVGLALLVYPSVLTPAMLIATPGPVEMTLLVMKEALVGLTIGFVAALVFEAVRMGGQVIDAVRGQTMANVLVPQLPERVSVTADYLYQLSIALFFALGGHLVFIATMVRSYKVLPPTSYPGLTEEGGLEVVLTIARLTADTIGLGVLFALPVVTAVLLADLVLALINRSAPQVNVFFLGMPLKALLGVGVVLLGLGVFTEELALQAAIYLEQLDVVLKMLTGAQ